MSKLRVKRIDELAKDIQPARDLWPAIAAAIEAGKATPAVAGSPRRARWLPAVGLAAAAALVALGVVIGQSLGPAMTSAPLAGTQYSDSALVPTAITRDAEYQRQRDQLLVEVQDRLGSMPAAEREKVAASLATLRRSIAEIEAALGRDPANALLHELFVNSCQEEMRALTAVRDSGSQET